MMRLTTTGKPADRWIALGCWTLAIGLLLALPWRAASDPFAASLITPVGSVPWWLTAAVCTVQTALLAWARRSPRTVLSSVTALPLLVAFFAPSVIFSSTHLAVAVAAFLTAPRRPRRQMLPWMVVAALVVAGGTVANGLLSGIGDLPLLWGEALVQGVMTIGIPALLSLALDAMRAARESQRKEFEALSREHDALRRERGALVRAAASEERVTMARELHDIAAHHLSGIVLMTGAADLQIDTDPAAARESVRAVRTQTRAVLHDIREVVGLVRGGEAAERSVENLAKVPELIDFRRAAGVWVRLEVREPSGGRDLGDGIGPLAQLVVYRMVQEALANAALHAAGAACAVLVDATNPAQLSVSVTDDGCAQQPEGTDATGTDDGAADSGEAPRAVGSSGFGLVGMRERADLIGADLAYGHTLDGGWSVRMVVHRDTAGSHPGPQGSAG